LIVANKDKIDWNYFRFRLKWINLEEDFFSILKGFELGEDQNIQNLKEDIFNKFNNSKQ